MNIIDLEGMNLVGLAWNEFHFDLKAIDASGVLFQATLSNPDQSPIHVTVHWLDMRMISEEDPEISTLGELETIGSEDGVVHIEADAGYFSVTAAKVFVQQLTGLQGNAA